MVAWLLHAKIAVTGGRRSKEGNMKYETCRPLSSAHHYIPGQMIEEYDESAVLCGGVPLRSPPTTQRQILDQWPNMARNSLVYQGMRAAFFYLLYDQSRPFHIASQLVCRSGFQYSQPY